MKAFTEYLKELSFYEDAKRALMAQKTVLISGCADAQKAQMLCGQGEDYPYKLVLTFSDVKAKELYEDYSFFDKNTILLKQSNHALCFKDCDCFLLLNGLTISFCY